MFKKWCAMAASVLLTLACYGCGREATEVSVDDLAAKEAAGARINTRGVQIKLEQEAAKRGISVEELIAEKQAQGQEAEE